ncbi:class F sortase [Herbiconiux sp. YIM B11900]|uniref:class F sortase n=1 Tax=Herbiconiux sp. YIM B11900 TaxID=3404131 RepID=UPI003F82AD7A
MLAVVVGTAVLLSGCAPGGPAADASAATPAVVAASASPTPHPRPTPSPDAGGPAVVTGVPDVPRTDAGLGAATSAPTVPPTRVRVPELGIDVSVAEEGVDADGALALPSDPGIASWYRWGPSPWSAAGATVIASHVDSLDYGIGQFARLAGAPVGTAIAVEAADGRVGAFAVQTVELQSKTQIDWSGVFDRTGAPRLVLVTCGGEFDYDTGHYLSNVIVTAVPIA